MALVAPIQLQRQSLGVGEGGATPVGSTEQGVLSPDPPSH